MKLKFYNYYDSLFNKNKPLLSQLKDIKKSCFMPYVTNEQLIKYVCDECSDKNKHNKCDFYEFTHLDYFKDHLLNIFNDNNIYKPYIPKHEKMERLCYDKINLKIILEKEWLLYNLEKMEPESNSLSEHHKWKLNLYNLKLQHPCYCINKFFKKYKNEKKPIMCTFQRGCNFWKNNIARILILDNIIDVDINNELILTNKSEKTEDGYYKNSLYYQLISKENEKKILNGKNEIILNYEKGEKIDAKNYKLYEKLYNKLEKFKKKNTILFNFQIMLLLNNNISEDIINTFILIHRQMKDRTSMITKELIDELSKSWNIKIKSIKKSIEELLKLKLLFNDKRRENEYFLSLPLSIKCYIKENILSENLKTLNSNIENVKLMKIDLNLLQSYKEELELNSFYPIFYEWFLSKNEAILRKNINKLLNISTNEQNKLETQLKIKKIYLDEEKKINKFLMNYYICNAIFKEIDEATKIKIFEKIKKTLKK